MVWRLNTWTGFSCFIISSVWFFFNLSLTTCENPSSLKCASITPLHKGCDPQDMNNYRPISIINSVAKIFEKLIINYPNILMNLINYYNILSVHQSVFWCYFSTTCSKKSPMKYYPLLTIICLLVPHSLSYQKLSISLSSFRQAICYWSLNKISFVF